MKNDSTSRMKLHKKLTKARRCLGRIQSFSFLSELCLLNDCLAELTHLSLFLQKENAPTYCVWSKIKSAEKAITEYGFLGEQGNGNDGPETAGLLKEMVNSDGPSFIFRSVSVKKATQQQLNAFSDCRKRFCSTLVDQLRRRFRGAVGTILQCFS